MPGTITLKPLEANLSNSNELGLKGSPYCLFTMGSQRIQGKGSQSEGNNIHWNDSVILKMHENQPTCLVELKQTENISVQDLGRFEVDLSEIETERKLKKWYPFFSKDKLAGEILMEATFTPDLNEPESLIHKKAHQGSLPHGIDLDEYAREGMRWRMDPKNSIAKIAETNEFGDYQPHKALPHGDILHEGGSGMIRQGNYYSGQQTSYGEDFPMTHKSFGSLFGEEKTSHDVSDRANPRDYALFQQQAFESHDYLNQRQQNPSIVEKVYKSIEHNHSRPSPIHEKQKENELKPQQPNLRNPLQKSKKEENELKNETELESNIENDKELNNNLDSLNDYANQIETSTRSSTS